MGGIFIDIVCIANEKGDKRLEEENKQRITPKEKRIVSKLSDKNAPQFNHPEIQKEINATESFPKILLFLESDYEFLDFWLGDHKTVTLWQCIYGLGISNTVMLKQFLLQPGIDAYCKTAVS